MTTHLARLRATYERHERHFAIGFFILGFLFDIKMVERIDSVETIAQQIIYLAVLFAALTNLFFEEAEPDPAALRGLKRWYVTYRTALIHFVFGTLLNMYAIFFFKSSSLVTSSLFLILLVGLLLANESHRFKGAALSFKFALLSACLLSFSSCVVPIFVGHLGAAVFFLSVVIGCLPLVALAWWLQVYRPSRFERAKTEVVLPMACVLVAYVGLYLLKITPPVPLSIPFIGVYHGVDKTAEGYRLAHERPWWRVWHNGDQHFVAQAPDRIYVAFRVFSPTNFSDQVTMEWFWRDNRRGWVRQDSIPIRIVGGRHEGFRGYGVKSNYQPGEWKVQVETTDGREIGRVYFDLEVAPEQPRSFEYEEM